MLERYGVDRFVLDSKAKVVDANEQHGAELVSIDLPEDPDRYLRALKLRCPSTNAVYVVRVPPEMVTAQQALAWTAGLENAEDYMLAAES